MGSQTFTRSKTWLDLGNVNGLPLVVADQHVTKVAWKGLQAFANVGLHTFRGSEMQIDRNASCYDLISVWRCGNRSMPKGVKPQCVWHHYYGSLVCSHLSHCSVNHSYFSACNTTEKERQIRCTECSCACFCWQPAHLTHCIL